MKISINNFKTIGSIVDYELKPLTILSGNNSSGKSSFIQILLLLKQTIDIDSSKHPLYIEGVLFSVKDYIDIIRGKDKSNKLQIAFEIDKKEFEMYGDKVTKSIFDNFPDYKCHLNILYDFEEDSLYIKEFNLIYTFSEKTNYIKFTQQRGDNKVVKVESDNEYFTKGIYDEIPPKFSELFYSSIFPNSYEIIRYEKIDNPKGKGDDPLINEIKANEYPNLNSIKSFIKNYFNNLFYIGPLRTAPQDSYPNNKNFNSVGVRGENVAQILEKRKNEVIEVYLPVFKNDEVRYLQKNISLIDATNYWICDVFKFGKKLYAREIGENYSIVLVNNNKVEITIKHVGFGISQLLPIVVQGLLLSSGDTLILEQPEIHLHPKIQSLLFDFLYSLIILKKNIIIETHSDHFISRMRRRIAEDDSSSMKDEINLTFIEQGKNDIVFRSLDLSDFGTINYYPADFIERPDLELKALVKAQMKKRLKKND
jgi:predicted ATPase